MVSSSIKTTVNHWIGRYVKTDRSDESYLIPLSSISKTRLFLLIKKTTGIAPLFTHMPYWISSIPNKQGEASHCQFRLTTILHSGSRASTVALRSRLARKINKTIHAQEQLLRKDNKSQTSAEFRLRNDAYNPVPGHGFIDQLLERVTCKQAMQI